ncbi:MAG: NAD-dependent epimerase/dehydratase family protein [Pseudopelagicola sp.]|nr:NAD-dependent epimerase/dehydratase family protein [Pseudopelagicola sp.]
MKTALVLGAGGFIGGHMVNRLKSEGYWVRGVDIKPHDFAPTKADDFSLGDLTHQDFAATVVDQAFDEIYQFAADMGGAGYVFTGDHDAAIMQNSAQINLNVLRNVQSHGVGRIFYASSACIYPQENQTDPDSPLCTEASAYPANPDSDYGWEKLFSERLYLAAARQHGIACRIARYHNIFGPRGTWQGGKEKAPAALCRKVAEAPDGGTIDIWGDGLQTRSFLFIDDCIETTRRLMASEFEGPVNIGSEEMIALNDLARMVIAYSGKSLSLRHVSGPVGVRGRTSDNTLIRARLGWAPSAPLRDGIAVTYDWVSAQVAEAGRKAD